MEYLDYNDYELVYLAQEKNEIATEILLKKYEVLLKKLSKEFFGKLKECSILFSEVYNEAILGFYQAIENFNQDDNSVFKTFAFMCVNRKLNALIAKNYCKKNKFNNETITLDYEDEFCFYDILSDNITPESEMIDKESFYDLRLKIKKVLTNEEYTVYLLKLRGYRYIEIARILNVNKKSIYHIVERIKIKIEKILNK